MVEIYTDKNSVTQEQIDELRKLQVDVPNIPPTLKAELESRIEEFEEKHEWDALHGGDGWVKRMGKWDMIIVGLFCVFLIVWWFLAVIH